MKIEMVLIEQILKMHSVVQRNPDSNNEHAVSLIEKEKSMTMYVVD